MKLHNKKKNGELNGINQRWQRRKAEKGNILVFKYLNIAISKSKKKADTSTMLGKGKVL